MANFTGTNASETITGGSENDYITGELGNDTLIGGAGFDTLFGGAGDDIINGESDGNLVLGGDDFDCLVFSSENSTDFELFWSESGDIFVQRNGAGASDQLRGLAADVELLVFADKNIDLVGNQLLTGTAGDDSFGGYFGNDTIRGLLGNDNLNGSAGNDSIAGGDGHDFLTGSLGADTLDGGAGNDTLSPGYYDNNLLIGGSDTCTCGQDPATARAGDTVYYNRSYYAPDNPIVNLGGGTYTVGKGIFKDTLSGVEFVEFWNDTIDLSTIPQPNTPTPGNDSLKGTAGNDTLNGGGGNDVLIGFAGNDRLIGGPGIDTMRGGAGNDFYVVSESGDVVTEAAGGGTDTIQSSVTRTLGANQENLILSGGALINGTGNSLANRVTGNAAANLLKGQAGRDTLLGGGGQDTLIGAAIAAPFGKNEIDVLTGGLGADSFVLGVGASRLYDNAVASTSGLTDYALITDFTPAQSDRLQLNGLRTEYFLRNTSPVAGVPGKALHHDSNGDGLFNSSDELIAVIRGTGVITAANTIGTALLV